MSGRDIFELKLKRVAAFKRAPLSDMNNFRGQFLKL